MISIIIVNWNGIKWLPGCLDSINRQAYRDFEVILVDNASTDDSLNFVKNKYPQIKVIENSENVGFGQANNLGVKAANGDTVFFLNNDTVVEDNTLGKLISFKQEKKLEIIGPQLLNFKKEKIYQGKSLTIDPVGYLGWGKEIFFIEGCALMISKADFEKLGGFGSRYFMYSEDIDLCWRAQLFGMKLGLCQSAEVVHFGGGSSEPTQLIDRNKKHTVPIYRRFEVEKNNLRNLLKNYKAGNLVWVLPLFLASDFFESLFYLFIGQPRAFAAVWRAIWWNAKNIKSTFLCRQSIQKKRVIGDVKILLKMNFKLNKIEALCRTGIPKFK